MFMLVKTFLHITNHVLNVPFCLRSNYLRTTHNKQRLNKNFAQLHRISTAVYLITAVIVLS